MRPRSTEIVFAGKQFDVVVENWGDRERQIVRHPGSVAIVAVDRGGRVVLVRQTREVARGKLLELPAGTLDDGEQPLASARRELQEETGLHGGRWRELGAFWTSPGFLDERMHLFAAEDVDEGDARPEDDEDVELVRWPVDSVRARLAELEDAKTIAGLLLYLETACSDMAPRGPAAGLPPSPA